MTDCVTWRQRLPEDTVALICEAITQYQFDDRYQNENPPTAETAKELGLIGSLSGELHELLSNLSTVGKAAIFEASPDQRDPISRRKLGQLEQFLVEIGKVATDAAVQLRELHDPLSEVGQGAGSGLGKGSDLDALPASDGINEWPQFRNPKDKLAVRIIVALALSDDENCQQPLSGKKKLETLLSEIWCDEISETCPSWDRVTRQRKAIYKAAEKRKIADTLWDLSIIRHVRKANKDE